MADTNFVDYVKIFCKSGNGGPGSTHLRREKSEPKGGPALPDMLTLCFEAAGADLQSAPLGCGSVIRLYLAAQSFKSSCIFHFKKMLG